MRKEFEMPIFGVGAQMDNEDVTGLFLVHNIVGSDWDSTRTGVHSQFRNLRIGDLVFLKRAAPGHPLTVLGIGLVSTERVHETFQQYRGTFRDVVWLWQGDPFDIDPSPGLGQMRFNTIFQEPDPVVAQMVIEALRAH